MKIRVKKRKRFQNSEAALDHYVPGWREQRPFQVYRPPCKPKHLKG